jgi:hypothetical protein
VRERACLVESVWSLIGCMNRDPVKKAFDGKRNKSDSRVGELPLIYCGSNSGMTFNPWLNPILKTRSKVEKM